FLLDHAKESMMYKNRVIGLPFNASTILYYYNKTLFDKAGVKEIKTLDDLINVADKLCQKDENGKIVTYAISSVPTTYEMCAFIGSQKGGSYLTDMDNGHLGFATKTVFKEEGTLKAFLEKWAELYKTGGLKNSTSGVTTEFVSGQTASMFASTSNLTTVINAIDGRFELGVSYLPMVNEEATGGVNLGGGALFTFDQDENTSKAVYEFMKYLTSAESQLTWHIKTGYLPVNKDTYNLDEFKTHCKQNPEFKVASDQLLASNPKVVGLWIPNGYEVYYAFQSNIKAMLEENISIEETVDKMTNEIDRGLDAFNRQNLN
ncbi:MAG: extracellular solute-binding protein, partial [Spirochaetales bacterium]|nr:extracellular solute-binding protein [Spirochaetales bacterium]